jgi:hypothetical protein
VVARSIGLGKASTFAGFCARHDNDTFRELEDVPFRGSAKQCFLLAYRVVVMELMAKRGANESYPLLTNLEKGKSLDHQLHIRSIARRGVSGTAKSLREFEEFKLEYDHRLLTEDFADLQSVVIYFDGNLPYSGSGTCYPRFDLHGSELQRPTCDPSELVTFHAIQVGDKGAFVMAWLRSPSGIGRRFAESLRQVEQEHLPETSLRIALATSENVYISPTWWRSLDESTQDLARDLHGCGIAFPMRPEDLRAAGAFRGLPRATWVVPAFDIA